MTPINDRGPCACGQVRMMAWAEHHMVSDGSCHGRRVCFEAPR